MQKNIGMGRKEGSGRKPTSDEMELKLVAWIEDMRDKNLRVSVKAPYRPKYFLMTYTLIRLVLFRLAEVGSKNLPKGITCQ